MEAPYFRWKPHISGGAAVAGGMRPLTALIQNSFVHLLNLLDPSNPIFSPPVCKTQLAQGLKLIFPPNQFPWLSCQESWLEKAFLEFWKLVQSETAFAWSSKIIGFVSVEIPFVVTIIIINATIPSSSPQCPAHGLIVHVGLVLVHAPEPGHRLAVDQLEHPLLSVAPLDELGTALGVLQNWKNMRSYISYIGFVIY